MPLPACGYICFENELNSEALAKDNFIEKPIIDSKADPTVITEVDEKPMKDPIASPSKIDSEVEAPAKGKSDSNKDSPIKSGIIGKKNQKPPTGKDLNKMNDDGKTKKLVDPSNKDSKDGNSRDGRSFDKNSKLSRKDTHKPDSRSKSKYDSIDDDEDFMSDDDTTPINTTINEGMPEKVNEEADKQGKIEKPVSIPSTYTGDNVEIKIDDIVLTQEAGKIHESNDNEKTIDQIEKEENMTRREFGKNEKEVEI